ncbi:MAG: cation diffusion facilitator family transporter [Synechococcales bacterium]|nr:cation diffusion facilitator family transporter [Synechococcales bacterium]
MLRNTSSALWWGLSKMEVRVAPFRGNLSHMSQASTTPSQSQSRSHNPAWVLFVTLWLVVLTLVIKVWVAWLTRSIALFAEALHTLIDCLSVVLSLISIASPDRYNNREVWGHGKLETAIVLSLIAMLGFGGFSLAGLALYQLGTTPNLSNLPSVAVTLPEIYTIAALWISQGCLALWQKRIALRQGSLALRTNAKHLLQDSWLNGVLVITLVGLWQGYHWLDPVMGIGLVITAGFSCWRVLNWQLPTLVRQIAIAPEAIHQIVRQVQGITDCYRIRSRGVVGRQVWIEMQITLHPEFMTSQTWVKGQIEAALRDRYGPIQVKIEVDQDDFNEES